MDDFEARFFEKMPEAIPLYEAVKDRIFSSMKDVNIKIGKSQISFYYEKSFAFVWLPIRKIKNRPDTYIILSFGLGHQVESPRIAEAVEPYPGRWTHHVIIQDEEEIDGEIMDWLRQAYEFSTNRKSHPGDV